MTLYIAVYVAAMVALVGAAVYDSRPRRRTLKERVVDAVLAEANYPIKDR